MKTRVFVAAAAGTALVACRGASPKGAGPPTVVYCASAASAARDISASLAIKLGFDLEPPKGALATIQIEGETTKSNQPVATNQTARYELARGMYDIRVAAEGYETLRARVVLRSGCAMDLPIAMRQRPAK